MNQRPFSAASRSSLAAGTVVASVRAYANSKPGLHALKVTVTDSAGGSSTRIGNFEVVAINAGSGRRVKNIIFMPGDGMGAAHRTAAPIMAKGYLQGTAQDRLAMDTFPFTGMVMTLSPNSIVTDSAPGTSNHVNGNKAQNNQEGVFRDDTTEAFDNPRVEFLSAYLHLLKEHVRRQRHDSRCVRRHAGRERRAHGIAQRPARTSSTSTSTTAASPA